MIVYDSEKKLENNSEIVKKIENNIEKWTENDLRDLYIGEVLQSISIGRDAKAVIRKYCLKGYFDRIAKRLNNYVHSNGISYYNKNLYGDSTGSLLKELQSLVRDMRFITVTFLFLLTLCSPSFIMANDYLDYLECGINPPDGAQYWVAPFIDEFFKENLDLIDESCIQYLQDTTFMVFE